MELRRNRAEVAAAAGEPEVRLHRREPPPQQDYKEVLVDDQLCVQDRNFRQDRGKPESFPIKEEPEEINISQRKDWLVPKQECGHIEDGELDRDHQLHPNGFPGGYGVGKILVKQEEDIGCEHGLLDVTKNPKMKSQQTDVQLQVKDEEVPSDQLLCKQEDSSPDQEIKEDYQEMSISQENKLLVPGTKDSTFMLTPPNEESVPVEMDTDADHQLLTPVAERIDQIETKHFDLGSMTKTQRIDMSHIGSNNNPVKKSIQCPFCGRNFAKKSQLKVHLRVHTGERPHSCETCGKMYRFVSSLNTHKRSHTGVKPYSCETCGKCFSKKFNLTVHIRTHTGEKPYPCITCGKSFTVISALNQHTKLHTGEKPYFCEICGRSFSQSHHLKTHMTTHTGEKPYSCETCGKRFSFISSLNYHIGSHAGKKPFPCETCGKCFAKKGYLKVHMQSHVGAETWVKIS